MFCWLGEESYSTLCLVLVAVAVVLLSRWLLSPNVRRAAFHPARAASPRKHPRGTGADLPCVAPGTGESLGNVKCYTPQDVANAQKASRAAATEGVAAWARTSFEERRAVLQEIIDWVVQNQQEIIELSVRDSGKTSQSKHTNKVGGLRSLCGVPVRSLTVCSVSLLFVFCPASH